MDDRNEWDDPAHGPWSTEPTLRHPLRPARAHDTTGHARPGDRSDDPANQTPRPTASTPNGSTGLTRMIANPAWLEAMNRRRLARRQEAEAAARAAYEARLATFTGDCRTCFDEGYAVGALNRPCPDCAAGVTVRARQERERHDMEVQRVQARYEAIITAARFPPRCRAFRLATYPHPRLLACRQVRRFTQDWDGARGLILTGSYGVGKTGLMVGALHAIAERWAALPTADAGVAIGATAPSRRMMLFLSASTLLDELRQGYEDRTFSARMQVAQSAALLAIDDLGAERPTEWVLERLFAVINSRYEWQLPTFVTTNYGLEQLADRIGPRVVERLVETGQVIDVAGPNLRTPKVP